MGKKLKYRVLSPDLQVGFHYRLKNIKDLYFHEALSKTIRQINIVGIDKELNSYVDNESLQKLASFSLRGETIFPLPILLRTNPFLIGYYRLLFGISQKEFYSKGPFGSFRLMEKQGKISKGNLDKINDLCVSLIETAKLMVKQIDIFSIETLTNLQLLTVGPQLRGSMNNKYGAIATEKTFGVIKELVKDYIQTSTPTSIEIKNDSGRLVSIQFSSDPDIEIIEKLPTGMRGLISVEIKGGRDISNIHNRIGEAEKSHQKAKRRGYFEFMTIISVDINYETLKAESPTTTHFFHLDKISDINSREFKRFKDILSSVLGVSI